MTHLTEGTDRRILEAAYQLFYQRGFGRVSVDDIAAMARVTKKTLYYHFQSKDQLLGAVLEFHSELALTRIRRYESRYSGNAEEMIDVLFAELSKWSSKPGWTGAGFTRLAMELADLPGHPARSIAHHHKLEVENWWAELLQRAHVARPAESARQLVLLMEGATALILIHGDRSYADVAAAAAKRLLLDRACS